MAYIYIYIYIADVIIACIFNQMRVIIPKSDFITAYTVCVTSLQNLDSGVWSEPHRAKCVASYYRSQVSHTS